MQRPENKTGCLAGAGACQAKPGEAAQRALAEAAERHRLGALSALSELAAHKEINGRGGSDPVRYGDWEVKGIASDF